MRLAQGWVKHGAESDQGHASRTGKRSEKCTSANGDDGQATRQPAEQGIRQTNQPTRCLTFGEQVTGQREQRNRDQGWHVRQADRTRSQRPCPARRPCGIQSTRSQRSRRTAARPGRPAQPATMPIRKITESARPARAAARAHAPVARTRAAKNVVPSVRIPIGRMLSMNHDGTSAKALLPEARSILTRSTLNQAMMAHSTAAKPSVSRRAMRCACRREKSLQHIKRDVLVIAHCGQRAEHAGPQHQCSQQRIGPGQACVKKIAQYYLCASKCDQNQDKDRRAASPRSSASVPARAAPPASSLGSQFAAPRT